MRRGGLLSILLVLGVLPAVTAVAQSPDPRGVAVLPSQDSPYSSENRQFLDLPSVRPGQLLADTVTVNNYSDEPRQVLLYGVDGSPALGGGFGYSEREQEPEQVGAWLTLAKQQLLLPAQSAASLRIELRVPADAEPGTYVGGIAADPLEQGQTGPFVNRTRYVMSIRLVVPGGAQGATPGRGRLGGGVELTDVDLRAEGDQICPLVRYRNDSQDVVDPVVTVAVDGPFGSERTYRQPAAGVVGPEEEKQVQLPCLKRPLGPSQLALTLTSPRDESSRSVDSTWWPFQLVVGLLLLVLIVLALLATYAHGAIARRNGRHTEPDGDKA